MRKFLHTAAAALFLILAPEAVLGGEEALNLRSADIRAFIQDVARVTDKTFIIDPRVTGTVSIASTGAINPAEMFDVFLATLRANGLAAIPTGDNAYRIVPDENAAQQPAIAGGRTGFLTEVFRLENIDAADAAEALRPMIGRQGAIVPTPQGNTLIVADYADNLRRIRGLIAEIDRDRAGIETVTLRNSSPREIIAAVNQLLSPQGAQGQARNSRLALAPVESSNSIVLRGEPGLVKSVLAMIADLDRRAASTDDVRVVRLQHATAVKLLPVLMQLIGQAPLLPVSATPGPPGQSPLPLPAAGPAPAPLPAQLSLPSGGQANIAVFEDANALVISANPETQRILGDVIRQLDTRREQVLVEAIVVEVSDDTAKNLGVQMLIGGANQSGAPFFATNYTNSAPSLLALTGAIAGGGSLPAGNAALEALRGAAINSLIRTNGGIFGGGGQANDLLFVGIVNAVRTDATSNLLSTPSVMTLDNEKAALLVGQDIPITTGEVLGAANVNPFRTVRRQNVGIQLEVRPQINVDGAITLLLRQEVSSVAGPVSATSNELILNKREINTTVLVDDGDIVVLGGLLDQNERLLIDRVPGLGDLPGIGALFRNNQQQRNQRNLMVFIRPRIVRNPADAQAVTAPRFGRIRGLQYERSRDARSSLEDTVREYLRANPPAEPPGSRP